MSRISPDRGEVKDAIEYPFVPPGEYYAAYKSHSLFKMYGGAHKLRVFFTITDNDDRNASGVSVPAFFNVRITSMKNHSWTAGKRTRFMKIFCTVVPDYNPNQQKRIPMDRLKRLQVRIQVVTVKCDWKKGLRPEALHYSKVEEIRPV